jgi:hypothetical protein
MGDQSEFFPVKTPERENYGKKAWWLYVFACWLYVFVFRSVYRGTKTPVILENTLNY